MWALSIKDYIFQSIQEIDYNVRRGNFVIVRLVILEHHMVNLKCFYVSCLFQIFRADGRVMGYPAATTSNNLIIYVFNHLFHFRIRVNIYSGDLLIVIFKLHFMTLNDDCLKNFPSLVRTLDKNLRTRSETSLQFLLAKSEMSFSF